MEAGVFERSAPESRSELQNLEPFGRGIRSRDTAGGSSLDAHWSDAKR